MTVARDNEGEPDVKTITDKEFYNVIDRGDWGNGGDIVLERCLFSFCGVSETMDITKRTIVRNVIVRDCTAMAHTSVGPAILEDVMVENLSTSGELLILWGALLKHVTLKGRVGRIKMNNMVGLDVQYKPEIQRAFDEAKKRYYAGMDWALDIVGAEFEELDMVGVPVDLVRRDPETQVVIRREIASALDWRERIASDNYWRPHVDIWLTEDKSEVALLLAAPKAAPQKQFERCVRDLHALRQVGLALPD